MMNQMDQDQIKQIIEQVVDRMLPSIAALQKPIAPILAQEPLPSLLNVKKVIVIGADHGGFLMKEALKPKLQEMGYLVEDIGTYSTDAADYPDYALKVAQKVASDQVWRGIMIDGAGIGSCMVANKVKGVRAAMCYDHATANNSREHNDANLLTLGAGLIGQNLALQICKTFLETEFAGGRHQPRVDKIMQVEELS
ncbi:MAG: ribose 5-phosphate isomerase B [Anaerolineales bacterium]|nr:ribose 5-phosphate isomerase B [Anaerolineales bacterium]